MYYIYYIHVLFILLSSLIYLFHKYNICKSIIIFIINIIMQLLTIKAGNIPLKQHILYPGNVM